MLNRQFFDRIQKWEAGYQNHDEDKGNVNACGVQVGTNHGITARTVETLMGVKCPDEQFMRNMTKEYAFEVLQKFYEFYRIDEILNQDIANLVFNNFMGLPTMAGKTVQMACNRFQAGLVVDGAMGSKTLTALNSIAAQNKILIYNAILEEWIAYIQTTNPTFRQGLMNRVNDLFSFMEATGSGPVPVAETNNLLRIQTILNGALKGSTQDIVALVIGLVALLSIGVALATMKRKIA